MPEYNFQLRDWHALLGIIALLGFFWMQTYMRVRTVGDEMRDAVRETLLNEYSGRGPKDVARIPKGHIRPNHMAHPRLYLGRVHKLPRG
jgi:hypothetical protein